MTGNAGRKSRPSGRHSLERVHQRGDGHRGLVPGQQVHMVVVPGELRRLRGGHATPVLRHEDQMNVEGGNYEPAAPAIPQECHGLLLRSGVVQVRYRYRIYPAPGQQRALARAFGCARVVYNDCLKLRDACHAVGEKISDTEVQRRVVTLAKRTPERAWLADVASVALVQACQDARRAYRNWFALHGARLYLAKVGQMRVRWSRPLPSVPSSLTVIKEADGRYYASFVVQQDPSPLPACGGEVGIDVGLVNLAATSDGEIIANPRFLRKRERRLAR